MLFAALLTLAFLNDWEQWGGPERNFSADIRLSGIDISSPLLETWQTKVAPGNSGVIVREDSVFTQCRFSAGSEAVVALSAATGDLLWMAKYKTEFESELDLEFAAGPHSTPCYFRNSVFAIGSTGELIALNAKTGQVLWSRKLWVDFPATRLERGFAASPVCWNEYVIVSLGGSGCSVVALDIDTGATQWASGDFEGAYSSPVIRTIDGKQQIIALLADSLVSLDPETGVVLWTTPCPVNRTVHVCSPFYASEGRIFVCSSEESRMMQVAAKGDQWEVKTLWTTQALTPQVGNIVSINGMLIGPSSGSNIALLSLVDQETGKLLAKKRLCGPGFLIRGEDGIITLSDRGELAICQVHDQAIETVYQDSQFQIGRAWAAPALVGTSIFVRDANGVRRLELNNH